MSEQRIIEQLPFGARVEIDGKEVYVPRLLDVRGGRVVRIHNSLQLHKALDFIPAKRGRSAEWGVAPLDAPEHQRNVDAQDVFCHAEDNPEINE